MYRFDWRREKLQQSMCILGCSFFFRSASHSLGANADALRPDSNSIPLVGTLKMRDLKMRHQTAGVENAGLRENAGNDIVWNAAHCLCLLSFAGSKR